MKSLWPVAASIVIFVGLASGGFAIYFIGSLVGEILEFAIRAIPGLLYHLPTYSVATICWIGSVILAAITNPLHAICLVIGMLLVVTYLRGITGHFDGEKPIFRGSTVRTADDVFPDLDDSQLGANGRYSPFRGSEIGDVDKLFETPKEPVWTTRWQSFKNLFTRNSAGDDLP